MRHPSAVKTWKTFVEKYPIKRFDKGNIIIFQGEAPRYSYFIKEGVAKAYTISSMGEERVVTFNVAGELFPTTWTFEKTSVAIYFYEAFTDCQVYCVPREDVHRQIYNDQETLKMFLDLYVTSYAGMSMRLNALEHAKASEKVLHTLYYLAMRFGRDIEPQVVQIKLQLTHKDFANLVGLTRETTAIELSKLKKRDIISYHSQRYTVKLNKLIRMLGEDRFKDLDLEVPSL